MNWKRDFEEKFGCLVNAGTGGPIIGASVARTYVKIDVIKGNVPSLEAIELFFRNLIEGHARIVILNKGVEFGTLIRWPGGDWHVKQHLPS